jgi:glycosyltransferase involved in cell wall biosynthesis
MRIGIVDYAGHPFQVQLSRKLAERGHDVLHLYFGQAITPHGMLMPTAEDPKTLDIEGVRLDGEYRKYSYVRRWWQEQLLAKGFVRRIERFRPEFVIVANAPLDIAHAIQRRCLSSGVSFILWQQDVYSVALAAILTKKLGVAGAAVALYYHWLEAKILALSDAVVVISPAFAALDISSFGLSPDRIAVIRNWAAVDDIRPGQRDNPWSRAQGLVDRKVVMYSGTLGSKHNPAIILRIAEHLSGRGDAVLVVVSEGPNVRALEQQVDARRLAAIKFLPFQPYEDFPNVLASATVLIGILEDEAGVFSVPSKVLSYLCSGRPILLCAPAENLASRIVLEAEAGAVYSTSRPQDLLSGLDEILNDNATALRLGDNGRRYAEMEFDIESIADRFLEVFANAAHRRLDMPRRTTALAEAR